jgi:exosortase A-associated hydrolase 1
VTWSEEALVLSCGEEELVGILAAPKTPAPRGVLILVGGPQYRAGSHRQFTLLARDLAQSGVASLRFDYRGMGDSSGGARTFEHAQEDIGSAIDRLMQRQPALQEVVIWGLCDAASASLFYAHGDKRVSGLVLLNPWVRTDEGMARAQLRHYYGARLLRRAFWQKLLKGEVAVLAAFTGFARRLVHAFRRNTGATPTARPLPERMEDGLRRFQGRVLLILSGNDLTAQEFKDLVGRSPGWQALLQHKRVTRHELSDANHTFSRREWRDQVSEWTRAWLMQPPD